MATLDDEAEVTRGLLTSTVRVSSLRGSALRLDAKYYQEEFTLARARVAQCGLATVTVADLASAFVPARSKLVTTASPNAGAPYLKAHEAFKTRPESDRYVAAARLREYETYLLRAGMILTPSSGRNLGPTAFVGSEMAHFAMTDIMRVCPRVEEDGYYLLGYLRTPTGQALIRRGRTGTNVDHLAPADMLSIPVVWPDEDVRVPLARRVKTAEQSLDRARSALDEAERMLHERAGLHAVLPGVEQSTSNGPRVFTRSASSLTLRLDAEFYSPAPMAAREAICAGKYQRLGEAASLLLLGRYKRYYVDAAHGRPILSGTQLLQLYPVNLRYISDRSFTNPTAFVLRQGWTVFTCDGRAEEGLGSPAFVSSLWDGWMASNHVMRAVPRAGVRPGFLYLALRSPYVQAQLKARATGSVIDALEPATVGDVVLPALDDSDMDELGAIAEVAWERIADAVRQTEAVVRDLEAMIVNGYERGADA